MNILHLKYAVEIEKARFMSKAADNLYMAQPNLSRALKELEDSLGITIFDRTQKGMMVTPEGEEFLRYAKQILKQIDEVEQIYTKGKNRKQTFSVSVPRASYISSAFARFAAQAEKDKPLEFFYKETNSARTINNLLHADYNLGIVRYAANYEKYYAEMLHEKGLSYELLNEFSYVLVMSKNHPLANKEDVTFDDLSAYTEIAHADPYVPSLSFAAVRKEELPDNVDKRIFVFERASQFDILSVTPGTFMWVSPLPDDMLEKFGLVQRHCKSNTRIYRDGLIYRDGYRLSVLDQLFITEVRKAKDAFG